MTQTLAKNRPQECTYSFISDAGAVTLGDIVRFLTLDELRTERWLRNRVEAGNLFRDEFGAYRTSCPWPRAGL